MLLLALLSVNPAMHAANRKARPAQKAAKTAPPAQQEDFQKTFEKQIASLKEDVYTRATWKKLQEVKLQADDTAASMRLVMFGMAGVGFILGCVVTVLVTRRMGGSDEGLKIT